MDYLRIGVAGLGHGRTLLGANLAANAQLPVRVTALCDTNQDTLAATATEYNVAHTTTDFNALIARDDLDIIGIYTPGPLHAEQIVAALEAGKHVMVTKSMVYSIEEAERVIKAVDRSGKILLVTQSLRGRYDFMEAKRACDAGELGELFMAEAHYVHDLRPVYAYSPWRVQMPQDLILGGACHPIDLCRWFMGDVEEVHCYGLRSGVAPDYPQEDNFIINLKFTSGKIGRIANLLGIVHPPGIPGNGLTLYGTKGSIHDHQKHLDPQGHHPARTYTTQFPAGRGHYGEMIIMMQHMADCIRNGETPWVDVRTGAKIVSTGLACWESLRTGQPVKVRNEF